jgi:magnesium transporter
MREVINRFSRLESPLVNPATQVYLHDIYDHTIQTIDIIEGFRDVVSGMLDIYLSNINIRTNDIMKVLTIVSTIFVPLTFISSLYGMNFDYMPELHLHWAYPAVILLMVSVAIGMLMYFRRKQWI